MPASKLQFLAEYGGYHALGASRLGRVRAPMAKMERESACVCVRECVCERERECVCVCMSEKESERVRESV